MKLLLTYNTQEEFKEWLNLNLLSISWEGRYLEDFNQVWDLIFEPEISIEEQFHIFYEILSVVNQGPILTWFKWLIEKYICFLFLKKDLSLENLSEVSGKKYSEISLILRAILVEYYPYLEDKVNERLQVGSILSPNLDIKFSILQEELNLSIEELESTEDDVLKSLEVTLYSDWKVLKDYLNSKDNLHKAPKEVLRSKSFFKRQIRFISELTILFIIGGLLIFLIKVGNKKYEDYLVEKISLFSPNFFWLDKTINFKSEENSDLAKIDIKLDELEELEKLENKKVFDEVKTEARFEVESDVVLTSVDTLPKDFEVAGFEISEYEELRKGGYRNNRYGRRKAYRVMMTSVNPDGLTGKVKELLEKYGTKQVDNVKPGTHIPGGLYFNIYVPRKNMKKFMSEVTRIEDHTTILESRTIFGGPVSMDKVFIWIKSI